MEILATNGRNTVLASRYLKLDSNVLTGGGTDQTELVQAILDKATEWGSLVLEMDGATCTVPRLRLDGLAQNGTLAVTDALVAADPEAGSSYVTVDGNLTVAAGVALDLGLDADAPGLASGTEFPLAVVSGSVATSGMLKARNAGARTKGFRLRVANGVLWASPSSGGTTLIFR